MLSNLQRRRGGRNLHRRESAHPGLGDTMPNASEKIPADLATELRKLAHDLSNALETIVQAAYLIGQSNPPEGSRRFVALIDNATKDAVKINQNLRQLLRDHS
jgi:hypothetical protein